MRAEIKALHQRLETTTVYVTHDQVEAMTMADRIVVMHDGIIEQIGAPLELYDQPANLFVAGFIGSPAMNFIAGRVEEGIFRSTSGLTLPLPEGVHPAHASGANSLRNTPRTYPCDCPGHPRQGHASGSDRIENLRQGGLWWQGNIPAFSASG